MNRVLVAAPLRTEARWLRRGVRDTGGPRLTVVRTGPGRRSDGPAPEALAGSGGLVVAGVCGAVADGLRPGDVVVADEVRGPAGAVHRVPSARLLAAAVARLGLRVHVGPLATTERVVTGGAARARLAAEGVLAVDMESGRLLEALERAGAADLPRAVVRVVVDTPGAPLVHPGTVLRGLRALRVLRRIAPALDDWAAALGAREIVLAEPRSFCAGVERAIATVERLLEDEGAPVFVRRQIVHNAHVVASLERRGAVFVQELDEVPGGSTVVFSAHGVTPDVHQQAADRRLRVIDATCPLVAKVHAEARHAAGRGDTVVLIGHEGHEEVVGTMGEVPDRTVLVGTVDDVDRLHVDDGERVTYLTQTTLAVDETSDIVAALVARFPKASGPGLDDICYATTNRQNAVREVATDSDVVLVVGSGNSSNSARLVEVSERCGARAYLVEDAAHVQPSWLAGARRVGLTAGASAPPHLVDQLAAAIAGLGPVTISTEGPGPETVSFGLPKEVRP